MTEYKNHQLTNLSEDLKNLALSLDGDEWNHLMSFVPPLGSQQTCLLAANIVEKFLKTQEHQINTIVEMAKLRQGFEWRPLKEEIMREEFWDCLWNSLQVEIN